MNLKKYVKDNYDKLKELVLYGFWGVMTTIINYAVYAGCNIPLKMTATLSNIIAWVVAVIFAFVVNKQLVFNSKDWSFNILFKELWQFVAARLLSGVLETFLIYIFVDRLGFNGLIMKIITNIIVVIINYILSKLFIFKKPKNKINEEE